jgi:predicted nuclease of restriction endonuclease-like (RecB) superfamily
MVCLYWDIGTLIRDRQQQFEWGTGVIDRLAADLREAFPDMSGFSTRNLGYMKAFAAAWPDRSILQGVLAKLSWTHNIALLEKLVSQSDRLWYAKHAIEHGWSHNILVLQIQAQAHRRKGQAVTNFKATLPPVESDMAAHIFKDPYLFDFLETADPRREREVEPTVEEIEAEFKTRADKTALEPTL